MYSVETQYKGWYIIDNKKNRFKGRYCKELPTHYKTVMPTPLSKIDSIFPRLKDSIIITNWPLS